MASLFLQCVGVFSDEIGTFITDHHLSNTSGQESRVVSIEDCWSPPTPPPCFKNKVFCQLWSKTWRLPPTVRSLCQLLRPMSVCAARLQWVIPVCVQCIYSVFTVEREHTHSLLVNLQIYYTPSVIVHVEEFISSPADSSFYQLTQKNVLTCRKGLDGLQCVQVFWPNVPRSFKSCGVANFSSIYSKQGPLVVRRDRQTPETCWLCCSSIKHWAWHSILIIVTISCSCELFSGWEGFILSLIILPRQNNQC